MLTFYDGVQKPIFGRSSSSFFFQKLSLQILAGKKFRCKYFFSQKPLRVGDCSKLAFQEILINQRSRDLAFLEKAQMKRREEVKKVAKAPPERFPEKNAAMADLFLTLMYPKKILFGIV